MVFSINLSDFSVQLSKFQIILVQFIIIDHFIYFFHPFIVHEQFIVTIGNRFFLSHKLRVLRLKFVS